MKKIYLVYSKEDLSDYDVEVLNHDFNEYGFRILNSKADSFNENDAVFNLISKSNLVIAILSYDNPNVLFEIGYALGLKKNLILIASPNFEFPPFLRNVTIVISQPPYSNLAFKTIPIIKSLGIKERKKTYKEEDIQGFFNSVVKNPGILDSLDSKEFENFMLNVFKINNFEVLTPSGKDQGYDFILKNYKGYNKILVEIKKSNINSLIPISQVLKMYEVIRAYDADGGMIITTGNFTNSAKEFAKNMECPIFLISFNKLMRNFRFTFDRLVERNPKKNQ